MTQLSVAWQPYPSKEAVGLPGWRESELRLRAGREDNLVALEHCPCGLGLCPLLRVTTASDHGPGCEGLWYL